MSKGVEYPYVTLEDFLISNPLTVDGQLDDGWGALFPVKGREIDAAILFADISSFARRTFQLTPTETLIFVNNFLAWISAEALRKYPGIVDKYIGDEVMVVFSQEFGSRDPFADALHTARCMADNDIMDYCPHIGIATGLVTVGFIGTSLKYDCTVYGMPVALAKRCATVPPKVPGGASIIFPSVNWKGYKFEEFFPPHDPIGAGGVPRDMPQPWQMLPPRRVEIKNMPAVEVIEVANREVHEPEQTAEDRARDSLRALRKAGLYRPSAKQTLR